MGCGASKESTEIAVASTCSRAEQRRQNQQLTGRSPSPGSRSQIVPSVRDSSSSPQPATADPVLDPVDPSAAKPGSDLAPELAAGAPVLDLPSSAAEVVENTVVDTVGVAEYTAEVTADVVEQTAAVTEVATAVVEYTTEVVEHTGEFVKYTATTTTTGAAGAAAVGSVRAPSPPSPSPPSPHLCYSCQSVIDKLDDTNVAVTINFSTSSLLAARKNRLSRTPSPAPRAQPGDSRASTPKSNRAPEPVAAAAAVVPVEFHPPEEDQVATSVSAAESRASSRVSSPVSSAAAANPAAGERERPDEITSFAKLSRTPSPAPRPIVSESRSSTPKFVSAESRSSSPAPVAVLESKASSRAPSPHAETESRASSPRQLLNSFRKHVSRSPSPGQVLTQTSRHSSPAAGSGTGSEIAAKRHSSRSASPAPPPPPPDQAQVVRKQNLPADFPVDGFSKSSSRASIASLKDSKSCSPAASERNLKASSYSPSPPAESGASSKSASPAVSIGVGDDNEFLSASAAAKQSFRG